MNRLLFHTLLILTIISCNKNQKENYPNELPIGDDLPESVLNTIDTMNSNIIPLNSILLPNGQVLEEFMNENDLVWYLNNARIANDPFDGMNANQIKNILLGRFLTMGKKLTNRSNFQYSYEGADKPAQNGLAYSYGQKDYTVRQRPPAGSCTDKIYGIDCSGMIYHIYKYAGLNIPVGNADDQHKISVLNSALREYQSMSDLNYSNLGRINPTNIQSGDIVYWSKLGGASTRHIGIALKDLNDNIYIYQSNGSSSSNCSSNYSTSRGPRTLSLNTTYWFESNCNWEVVRLNATNNNTTIECNRLLQCGGVGNPGPTILPLTNSYCVYNGTPPYSYKLNNGSWQSTGTFTFYQFGNYIITAKDNNGCQLSFTVRIQP